MTSMKVQFRSLNAYDLHKRLINDYVLSKPGATQLLRRDTSRDKNDLDVIRENHRFLWEGDNEPKSWEEKLAKKYYDKLFKEYCISDLSRYKDNLIAMRWRTEQEVVNGRGQFTCGNKHCQSNDNLKTWEVNFGYLEKGNKKNALVKLRLCHDCSYKLNYKSKKREIKRQKRKRKLSDDETSSDGEIKKQKQDETTQECVPPPESGVSNPDDESIWSRPREEVVEKSREDEFEEFLEELLL